jgi:hypothetical protein
MLCRARSGLEGLLLLLLVLWVEGEYETAVSERGKGNMSIGESSPVVETRRALLHILDEAFWEASSDVFELLLELWQRLRLSMKRDDELGERLVVDRWKSTGRRTRGRTER